MFLHHLSQVCLEKKEKTITLDKKWVGEEEMPVT